MFFILFLLKYINSPKIYLGSFTDISEIIFPSLSLTLMNLILTCVSCLINNIISLFFHKLYIEINAFNI